jgi:hypothetical protein
MGFAIQTVFEEMLRSASVKYLAIRFRPFASNIVLFYDIQEFVPNHILPAMRM